MKGFREALALMFESILISTDLFAVWWTTGGGIDCSILGACQA
jgi:hypothetical protein